MSQLTWSQSVQRFVDFWAEFKPDDCTAELSLRFVHPQDRGVLQRTKKLHTFGAANVEQFLDASERDRNALCFNVLPEPYCGDLSRARIFILQLNPGLGPANFFELTHVPFRRRWNSMIRQDFETRPRFWHLDCADENVLHGGFGWWNKKLGRTIRKLASTNGTYCETMAQVANRIAAVDLVPYHSISAPRMGPLRDLQSVKYAMEFTRALVARFNQFERIWGFAAIATIGDGGNHGCEGDFGKDVCCEVERRGAPAA